ncbi:hypothetical protein DWU99_18170 [Dyella psychrodurans]|uniref:Uncharacterized protein n=1 Tax=Dyella psychrodurans TaxID=1927960 RepID=A0A370WXW4_9GAMM|nr:hypothetical protein DWU99_18170 [Dyella psychrodurans]
MAIFEEAGTAYNTDLIANIGPAKIVVGTRFYDYTIRFCGSEPVSPRFTSEKDAFHSRKKLVDLMKAKEENTP